MPLGDSEEKEPALPVTPEERAQAQQIAEALVQVLHEDGYEIRLPGTPVVRVVGVHEGELAFALRCKVFKKEQ